MRTQIAVLGLLVAYISFGCGDGDGSAPTSPTAPPPPPPTIETFTLSVPDGYYDWSHELTTLSVDQSFDVQFKPTKINKGDSGFSNTVEFWVLKRQLGGQFPAQTANALCLSWDHGAEWWVDLYNKGWFITGNKEVIHVGGAFRTVTIRRGNGFVEWSLDGNVVLNLNDTVNAAKSLFVYTRVVGTAAKFKYQVNATSSRTLSKTMPQPLQLWEGKRIQR